MLGCISLNGQAQTQTQVQTHTQTPQCNKTVYLTFDTGNMSVAQAVADILSRQHVKATFFLANEKTSRGDYSLDDSWKPYWQELARQGHHFGSHTYDHTYFVKDGPSGEVFEKPQFGPKAAYQSIYAENLARSWWQGIATFNQNGQSMRLSTYRLGTCWIFG